MGRSDRSGRIGLVGRAERFAESEAAEIWRFTAADVKVARRLAELGERGVGGFVAWGERAGSNPAASGAWARREVPVGSAEGLSAIGWREAVGIARDVARALAACEESALSPGRLHPACIARGDGGPAWIVAEPLVRALVGAPSPREDGIGRWTPPDQAAGAPWDAAANRYVLGLVMYRLVAGEHPFGGAGLRHAIAGQAIGAPPFEAHVAARARPGVQALVLAMLDPDARARPRDAGAIARRCDELLAPTAPAVAVATMTVREGPPSSSKAPRVAPERAAIAGRLGAPASIALAIAGAGIAALLASSTPSGASAPAIAPARPVADARPASCASCHAREVAEWSRSVMAHAARSPLFGALESVVEEQVGKGDDCPNGAGVLRFAGRDACVASTGRVATASGGEGWCVRCHAPIDSLARSTPAWPAHGGASSSERAPLRDVLAPEGLDGVACGVCHESIGPVAAHARAAGTGAYEGNATWRSTVTGETFSFRPEDARGVSGIGNSGYSLDPASFLTRGGFSPHQAPSDRARAYQRSSEACGACHDVRLFGTDVAGVIERGEHFKRLRNAYSEWRTWAGDEARAGRTAPTCQGCHMSLFPGVCVEGANSGSGDRGCPPGLRFEARAPGSRPLGRIAPDSASTSPIASHAFASVDVPLGRELDDARIDDARVDASGTPLGVRARRDLLLSHALRLAIDHPRRIGAGLEVPIVIENVGAGHRVPAGFSQEREIWVELSITDLLGRSVYRVGHLDRPDEDLRDKIFTSVNVDDTRVDVRGRPLGMFGADVVDGPDVPRWSPISGRSATRFRGRGLINLQNGFVRCVRCIGEVDAGGACVPLAGQGVTRADRFEDGDYDADTGECRSNLAGAHALFETYFPVGALDATRGIARAPDAIVDTRSAPPGVPIEHVYAIGVTGFRPPFRIEARLLFRAFPPYLVRAFARYEARMAARGARPSGPQVDESMLRRIDVVELAREEARVE